MRTKEDSRKYFVELVASGAGAEDIGEGDSAAGGMFTWRVITSPWKVIGAPRDKTKRESAAKVNTVNASLNVRPAALK